MMTVLDCNNFWSPSGGGVRRYHLEKLAYYAKKSEILYVFMMQDATTYTEIINETTVIEHVRAFKVPGNWEYRFLTRSHPIRVLINKYSPNIIEVGSPYVMPFLVNRAVRSSQKKGISIVGFWHADFPITYVKRFFGKYNLLLARGMEKITWVFARIAYSKMALIFSSSTTVIDRMKHNGLKNIAHLPLGVDLELFHPAKRDLSLRAQFQGGDSSRDILFFPHRFSDEKGVKTILNAYALALPNLTIAPTLIFAGTGPDKSLVELACQKYEHVHYVGFINSTEEMARWHASSDIAFALSSGETFGLSIVESLASGVPLIAVRDGAAQEHAERSQAGAIITPYSVEELADALIQLIIMKDRSSLQRNARSYAEGLSWSNCFEKQIHWYKKVAHPKAPDETI